MAEEKLPPEPLEDPAPAEVGPAASLGGLVADVVRKVVLAGAGALFLTEESARKLAREWKLPKELAGYLVQQASGAKDEVLRVVSTEIRRFLESEAFRRELLRVLESMAVEVNAEIRLKDAKGRSRTRVAVKPARPRSGEPEAEEP
ncbi:MAG TPA: hypothetical protein VFR85_03170 [Anaeromyxobacteraceae bacterium]|nr:hypothetical protein [Anaeromyxobacteraceae bacterium]